MWMITIAPLGILPLPALDGADVANGELKAVRFTACHSVAHVDHIGRPHELLGLQLVDRAAALR